MPELRKDPLLGRWVIVGTERVRRPDDFRPPTPPERTGSCVFCAGRERETPPSCSPSGQAGRRRLAPWRVVPSRFPALRVEGDLERRGHGLYDLMNGIGAHEVIVESPRHEDTLGDSHSAPSKTWSVRGGTASSTSSATNASARSSSSSRLRIGTRSRNSSPHRPRRSW